MCSPELRITVQVWVPYTVGVLPVLSMWLSIAATSMFWEHSSTDHQLFHYAYLFFGPRVRTGQSRMCLLRGRQHLATPLKFRAWNWKVQLATGPLVGSLVLSMSVLRQLTL